MKRFTVIMIAVVAAAVSSRATITHAQFGGKTVDRLYVLDCGRLHLKDGGRMSPSSAGKPVDLQDSCYLIRGAQGYLLGETGAPDSLVTQPAPRTQRLR